MKFDAVRLEESAGKIMSESETRTREHPETRFAASEDRFGLEDQFRLLMTEPDTSRKGHRQKALLREGPVTLAIYAFEAGSRLPDHVVDGVVLIHVLEGHLQVTTDTETHDMQAGHVLRLSAGVRHDVAAISPSRMLLTVVLEGPKSHP